jgi:hypothetical protein
VLEAVKYTRVCKAWKDILKCPNYWKDVARRHDIEVNFKHSSRPDKKFISHYSQVASTYGSQNCKSLVLTIRRLFDEPPTKSNYERYLYFLPKLQNKHKTINNLADEIINKIMQKQDKYIPYLKALLDLHNSALTRFVSLKIGIILNIDSLIDRDYIISSDRISLYKIYDVAIRANNLTLIKSLPNIESIGSRLSYAIYHGNEKIIEYFISKCRNYKQAIERSISLKRYDLLERLLKLQNPKTKCYASFLVQAIKVGNDELIYRFINEPILHWNILMRTAIRYKHEDVIQRVLAIGTHSIHWLSYAIIEKNEALMEILFRRPYDSKSALFSTITAKNYTLVERFMNECTDLSVCLSRALLTRDLKIADMLIEKGATFSDKDAHIFDALLKYGHKDLAALIPWIHLRVDNIGIDILRETLLK